MTFLEQVYAKRKKLADVLVDDDYSGIRELVEELYPDKAHFIYELLQNAEDTGATAVKFSLHGDKLVFEHNGRPFREDDVWGITNIGKGAKRDDEEAIGKFGVGFKAVFAYTETPRIWSPTFTFEISDLVLPKELQAKPNLDQTTRFEFPFNNAKKSAKEAYAEIHEGLEELSETTLLFLSHIESIAWEFPDNSKGEVLRIPHSEHHIEVLRQTGSKTNASSHFLRFTESVDGSEKQRIAIAIAFALDILPTSKKPERASKKLSSRFKIIPAAPGRVAVFFPAEKETSGLRFHLHAPFVPELSRASIKETPANQPLLEQLAKLAAASLHKIREAGLLTAEFLAVLPNSHDVIPRRYQCIREAIITAMNEERLTPTHLKAHAPAKYLLQAKASLKGLLTTEDIEFLVSNEDASKRALSILPSSHWGKKEHDPHDAFAKVVLKTHIEEGVRLEWAVGATQKNSDADRFLSGLAITDWDIDWLVKVLEEHLSAGRNHDKTYQRVEGPDASYLDLLSQKSEEWHQKFYALLHREIEPTHERNRLKNLCIVRLSSGKYSVGPKSYFPADEAEKRDTLFPRVAKAVFMSGENKAEQEDARKFLEEIGVREVGKAEQVEYELSFYSTKDWITSRAKIPSDLRRLFYFLDLKQFISLVEREPKTADLFLSHYIFEGKDGQWHQPSEVYLDKPYLDTGLDSYYGVLDDEAGKIALSDNCLTMELPLDSFDGYIDDFQNTVQSNDYLTIKLSSPQNLIIEVSQEKLANFAKVLGAITCLEAKKTTCHENPKWNYLRSVPGERYTSSVNKDFVIPSLDAALKKPTIALARLLWKTASDLRSDHLRACYQKNQTSGAHYSDSQLIHQLRRLAWVPQDNGRFVRPAEADRDLLPEGFAFDPGWPWIKAVRFGEEVAKRSEEHLKKREVAKELGFTDDECLDDAQWFAGLSADERQRVKQEYEKPTQIELPDQEPSNPGRRAGLVAEQAGDAPDRNTEKRIRSISVGREAVKKETAPYLSQQYTNGDGEMICQACKAPLPFKLADGNYYFEAVEFLPELKKRHYQNYLVLCPNHAAMFRHVNGSAELMQDMLVDLTGNELEVILAEEDTTIYFTKTHLADLKVIVAAECEGEE